MALFQQLRKSFCKWLYDVIAQISIQRNINLQPFRARYLYERFQSQAREHLADKHRHMSAPQNVCAFSRIEIEHNLRGNTGVRYAMEEGMQLQTGQVGEPDQSGQVVDENVSDRAPVTMPRHRKTLHPLRRETGRVLLVKKFAADAIGVSLESDRAVFQMRQHVSSNLHVV